MTGGRAPSVKARIGDTASGFQMGSFRGTAIFAWFASKLSVRMYPPPTNTEIPLETETRRKAFPLGALLLGVLLGWVLLSLFSHTAKEGVWNRLAGMMTGRSTR